MFADLGGQGFQNEDPFGATTSTIQIVVVVTHEDSLMVRDLVRSAIALEDLVEAAIPPFGFISTPTAPEDRSYREENGGAVEEAIVLQDH